MDSLIHALGGRRLVALTGAGISTESGIPDYRGPETARRARNPIQYRAFVHDPHARTRYWARSVVGWPRISSARPNRAHTALVAMERGGVLGGIITQNVDRLHHHAGSRAVIELHGGLDRVRCLACDAREPRAALQHRLLELNPAWLHRGGADAPDGDADLDDIADFRVAPCLQCGGTLKPDVVFFGECVPRPIVDAAFATLDTADALLVVGSSLTVYSGYRFIRRAAERRIPIAIINLGPTRGDPHATVLHHARAGDALPTLASALTRTSISQFFP
ncbi:MAG TPA: NAD-dependent protein deacetylase [Kofleriaceae bacterium]|nr:NAD-dependent protein deacetylase [Kofleriaceae bacterium]